MKKPLIVAPVALLLTWAGSPAYAVQPRPTNLEGVTATSDVAPDFDPLTATDAALDENGFPPRPHDKGQALKAWERAMALKTTRIRPVLAQTSIKHSPMARVPSNKNNVSNNVSSSNWSGYLLLNTVTTWSPSSFYEIFGDFVVPVAEQAFGACTGNWDYSSSWVGIDGFGTPDVLQAGVESDAYCASGVATPFYAAWYEWFPANEVRISNLPVSPGDDMYVQVWSTSPTVGHAFLENFNTAQAVSLTFSAPPGYLLVGNSAEFVVERPAVNGVLATLTNYTQSFWSQMFVEDFYGHPSYPAAPYAGVGAFPLTMVDNSGAPISSPNLLGVNSQWLLDENSAQNVNSP